MSITRFSMWAALLGTICVCALGREAPVAAQERKKGGEKDSSVVKGTLAAVDAEKNSVTVTTRTFNRATKEATETNKTFPLAKDAKVLQDAAAAKLADLKKGNPVTLRLEGASASSVSVDGGTAQGEFVSTNPDRNTITVIAGRNMEKRVYHLLKTTTVTGGDGKEISVKDLKAGTKLMLTRSVEDDRTVVQIRALPVAEK
jgi:hypothetical protein